MKDLRIPGDGSPMDKIQFMRDNADDIQENYSYQKTLDDDELAAEKDEFTALSISIQQITEEKERIMAEINERLKVKKELAKTSLMLLRTGRMEVSETVYFIKDENEGKIGTYNQNGVLLYERPMKATERQRKMFSTDQITYKTGTDE